MADSSRVGVGWSVKVSSKTWVPAVTTAATAAGGETPGMAGTEKVHGLGPPTPGSDPVAFVVQLPESGTEVPFRLRVTTWLSLAGPGRSSTTNVSVAPV